MKRVYIEPANGTTVRIRVKEAKPIKKIDMVWNALRIAFGTYVGQPKVRAPGFSTQLLVSDGAVFELRRTTLLDTGSTIVTFHCVDPALPRHNKDRYKWGLHVFEHEVDQTITANAFGLADQVQFPLFADADQRSNGLIAQAMRNAPSDKMTAVLAERLIEVNEQPQKG